MKTIYPNQKDPVRRNIERVTDLRDEAVHLLIAQVPKDVLAILQSCVLNYHKALGLWFGISLSDVVPVGMMTIVYDLSPDHFDMNMPALRKQLGKEEVSYLSQLQAEIRREREELGMTAEFSIVFDYKLALNKKAAGADVVLTAGVDGEPLSFVEIPRDPARTHPLLQTQVCEQVQGAVGGRCHITRYDIQAVNVAHNVINRPDFFYQSALVNAQKQYSQEYVNWIIEQFNRDPLFFQKSRKAYRDQKRTNT